MKRADTNALSSYGREVTFRIRRKEADFLAKHMRQDCHNEQMAFGLGIHQRTALGTVFMLNEVVLPGTSDLSYQSAGSVCTTREFLSYVYFRAIQTGQDIIEFHTHPGLHTPCFSSIDEHHAYPNAEYITDQLPEPITFLMVVGNNRFDAFDSVVWDRNLHEFRSVERMEILGRPSEIHFIGESQSDRADTDDQNFNRQMLIPGWNQTELARQRIGIVGLGGNGAPLFQTLIGMGAGSDGFVTIVDDDLVEPSNQPRIPYASPEHNGMPKVAVATQWAGEKSPSIPIYPYPCSVIEKAAQDRLKAATVIFGCVDNNGARMVLGDLAVRYGIPLIDLGCDIQVQDEEMRAGGQVRAVLPGENGCLVCCGGIDPSGAAIDLMDDAEHAKRAARGYVRNSTAEATPSVANLNGLTAQFAIAQFLALVNGEQFANWDYAHFDWFTLSTMVASTKQREDCPCCGKDGYLGVGHSQEEHAIKSEVTLKRLEVTL